MRDDLILLPQTEHDDLPYGAQAIVEGAMGFVTARAERYPSLVTL